MFKNKSMKKYFLKDSGEEIEFGDYIELEFSKSCGNAHIHKVTGLTFIPEIVEELLDMEIITVKETPDNKYAKRAGVNPSEEVDKAMLKKALERLDILEKEVSQLCSVVLGRDNGTKNTECSSKDF